MRDRSALAIHDDLQHREEQDEAKDHGSHEHQNRNGADPARHQGKPPGELDR